MMSAAAPEFGGTGAPGIVPPPWLVAPLAGWAAGSFTFGGEPAAAQGV